MGLSHDLEGITFLDYALNWLEIYRSDCSVPLQKQYASMIRFAADHTRKRFICDINANDLQAIFNKLSCYSSSYGEQVCLAHGTASSATPCPTVR